MEGARGREDGGPAHGYTIKELSAATGVPVRTIRYYVTEGLLPRPENRGRWATYREAHLGRLAMIARLNARGLKLRTIRDALDALERGESLPEWLDLSAVGGAERVPERPGSWTVRDAEIAFGPDAPSVLRGLEERGMLERVRSRPLEYHIDSPRLLSTILDLHRAGIPLDALPKIDEAFRDHLSKLTDELVELFSDVLAKRFAGGDDVEGFGRTLDLLRARGAEAVRVMFVQELGLSLERAAGTGETVAKASRRAEARRKRR